MMSTPASVARHAAFMQEVASKIIVVPPYETQFDSEIRKIVKGLAHAGAGYAAGGRLVLGTGIFRGGTSCGEMARLMDLCLQRAAMVAGLTNTVATLFWMAAFLNVYQLAHVDTLTESMRAMRLAAQAELAVAAATLKAGMSPDDATVANNLAAAKIRRLQARAMLMDPDLMNVFRLNLTLFRNRIISFISDDGYEVQLIQQPGNCWGGDWEFVTSCRHGSRELYTLAASVILCFRSAR